MKLILLVLIALFFGCSTAVPDKKEVEGHKRDLFLHVDVKDDSIVGVKNGRYAKKSFSTGDEVYIKPLSLIIRTKDSGKSPFQMMKELCLSGKKAPFCRALAYFYDDLENLKLATDFYTEACYLNDFHSCRLGGAHYLHRLKNYKRSRSLFEYSCNNSEDRDSCFNLGHIHFYKIFNPTEGINIFSKLCTKKLDNKSCIELAYFFKNQGMDQSQSSLKIKMLDASFKIFKMLCMESSDEKSCYQASLIAPKIKKSSSALDKKGCELGMKKLCP